QPGSDAVAPSNEPVFTVTGPRSATQIVERFSKIIETPTRIRRVDGFDPAVINVTALEPDKLRVQAIGTGVTTVVIVDENGAVYSVEIFVSGDVRHLQAYIDRMFPRSAVKALKVQDSVVLRGWVTEPAHITHIVEVAEQFFPRVLNQMQVGGVQQVALRVKVMEVQRSKVRRMGFNFLRVTQDGFLSVTPGQLVQISELIAPFGGPPGLSVASQTLADPQIVGGVVREDSIFQGFLEALKQEGLLKILAEPELVATNGRPAQLLSGGEFPILVPQSLGTVTIEWREFGVRLEAVPTILGQGRVRLELQPEVSERDFSNAVQINGLTVPGLTTRRANTQIEMNFGQTFVIAGLISSRKTAETNKIPILGEMPWVGAAFRRVRYDESETELVIMVTPELVAPLCEDQVPCLGPGLFSDTPTDRELYIDGVIEVPFYGDHCPGGNCPPVEGTFGPLVPPGPAGPAVLEHPVPPPPAPDGSVPGAVPPAVVPQPPDSGVLQPSPATEPVYDDVGAVPPFSGEATDSDTIRAWWPQESAGGSPQTTMRNRPARRQTAPPMPGPIKPVQRAVAAGELDPWSAPGTASTPPAGSRPYADRGATPTSSGLIQPVAGWQIAPEPQPSRSQTTTRW
ncbi:MAG: pilus assembly protein N-terminal domain-containing protein, partial [Planctomycetes bacterium]|nr:pilus assembly protein N-terminal domain-containing protein [Planctomycetota bacterium]